MNNIKVISPQKIKSIDKIVFLLWSAMFPAKICAN